MTAFLVISVSLALAAVAFIGVPLWRSGSRSFAAVVAIGLPLAALGLYTWTSDWSWDQPPAPAASRMPGSLEEVVALLAQRLETARRCHRLEAARRTRAMGIRERGGLAEAYTRSAGRDAGRSRPQSLC